jgi:MFS family permease
MQKTECINLTIAYILIVLWVFESIGMVLASPAEEALVADMAGKNIRGTAYGMESAIWQG